MVIIIVIILNTSRVVSIKALYAELCYDFLTNHSSLARHCCVGVLVAEPSECVEKLAKTTQTKQVLTVDMLHITHLLATRLCQPRLCQQQSNNLLQYFELKNWRHLRIMELYTTYFYKIISAVPQFDSEKLSSLTRVTDHMAVILQFKT